jgi:hypothetical protein
MCKKQTMMKINTNIQKLTNQVHNLWSTIDSSVRAYGFSNEDRDYDGIAPKTTKLGIG